MLEKLFSSLSISLLPIDCERNGDVRVELKKSERFDGVLKLEHV